MSTIRPSEDMPAIGVHVLFTILCSLHDIVDLGLKPLFTQHTQLFAKYKSLIFSRINVLRFRVAGGCEVFVKIYPASVTAT